MKRSIIDLTYALENHIPVFPGTPSPIFEPSSTIENDGFAEMKIQTFTHVGTHMDAPCHILPNARSLDEFPLEKFMGQGIVIDCSNEKAIHLDFLKQHGERIDEAEIILFYTGWQHKWNTSDYLVDEFPILTPEAIDWLLNFELKALGMDAISPDRMMSEQLPNHHKLLKKEILIIENLTNLDQLLGHSFELNYIPLKIKASDGAPVRAFAKIKI